MDAELYELLAAMGRDRYLVHQYQLDRHGPDVMAAVLDRGKCSDVVILRGDSNAYACRTPSGDGQDVLDPVEVFWQVAGLPKRVLTDLLALRAPGASGAPIGLSPVMVGYGLPVQQRAPLMRIRRRGL